MKPLLSITDLQVRVAGREVLKGINLELRPGEVHAIMGPNGSGKSTLSQVLSGRDTYEVTGGQVLFDGQDLLALAPEARAHAGVFMAFQYPVEIPGVGNLHFLRTALNARRRTQGLEELDAMDFLKLAREKSKLVQLDPAFMQRSVNEGFSGGEKKRHEILQLGLLAPKFAILDETDSGLDVDAMKLVSQGVNALRSPDRAFLVITHYQRLLDHIVVIENHQSGDEASVHTQERASGLRLEQVDIVERTNYPLTLQVHPGTRWGFGFQYQPSRVSREEILATQRRLEATLDAALELEEPVGRVLGALAPPKAEPAAALPRVVLAATFTVEPVLPYVHWWCAQARIPVRVEAAPYNQVFQQLLDPTSALARNTGVNVVLARCEDWVRDAAELSDEARLALLASTFERFEAALRAQPAERSTLVALLPVTGRYARTERERRLLESLTQRLAQLVAREPSLRALDLTRLAEHYQIDDVVDARQDRAGHVPYTEAYLAAMGTEIARAVRALRQAPFKVLAVDCDNTLWRGVVGEDGPRGVEVTPGHRALQAFLVERVREGFLVVLCSKNVEQDVWDVFAQNPDMLLTRQHVAAARINWKPKSDNLRELARELSLGLDSFLFLDDSGVECTEVLSACPEVLTVRLPADVSALPGVLAHLWAGDVWRATEEDRRRTELYRADNQREQELRSAGSLETFLSSLELRVTLTRVDASRRARVAQLTQRTNQFNLSTRRRDEAEVHRLLRLLRLETKTNFAQGRFTQLNLSTGQRKRLALIVSLLEDRPLLAFDEWAADQDPEFRQYFYTELLPLLKSQGKTLLVVTHDDRYFHVADRVVTMEYGRIRSIDSRPMPNE